MIAVNHYDTDSILSTLKTYIGEMINGMLSIEYSNFAGAYIIGDIDVKTNFQGRSRVYPLVKKLTISRVYLP